MDHHPNTTQMAGDALDDLGLVGDQCVTVMDHQAQHEEEATPA